MGVLAPLSVHARPFICEFGAHGKFQNPMLSSYGVLARTVTRKEKRTIKNSGHHYLLRRRTHSTRTNYFNQDPALVTFFQQLFVEN